MLTICKIAIICNNFFGLFSFRNSQMTAIVQNTLICKIATHIAVCTCEDSPVIVDLQAKGIYHPDNRYIRAVVNY
jgi:hypothetical protein